MLINKSINKNVLRAALEIAVEEAYQDEVVETDMERHIIGIDKDYPDNVAWMEDKIEWWISEAKKRTG